MESARGIARLEAATGTRFARIAAARSLTERRLGERRERFGAVDVDAGATVLLMGSWGRREVTSESDDDFMVLFEGPLRENAQPAIDRVAEVLGARAPGREEIFGTQVWLEDLRGKIGRDEDTNTNLTRRMLFVLESVPVRGEEAYLRARRALLAGYLEANVKHHRPPRFLLNDVIRYWRTIAVDFESKMRARKGEGWGLRNAKLRLSRKALFADGLLPVLECYRYPTSEMLDYLDERMSVPPLDRIADAFVDHEALDAGVRALTAYDEFLAILDDGEQRGKLKELGAEGARDSPTFTRVAELGKESRPDCCRCCSTSPSCAVGCASTSSSNRLDNFTAPGEPPTPTRPIVAIPRGAGGRAARWVVMKLPSETLSSRASHSSCRASLHITSSASSSIGFVWPRSARTSTRHSASAPRSRSNASAAGWTAPKRPRAPKAASAGAPDRPLVRDAVFRRCSAMARTGPAPRRQNRRLAAVLVK